MTKRHDNRSRGRVGEPVQVYLERPDRERLERLTARLDATKSDVLRRALETLEAHLRRPQQGAPAPAPAPLDLPIFRGSGLQPRVDLDDSAGLLDLMEGDAAR